MKKYLLVLCALVALSAFYVLSLHEPPPPLTPSVPSQATSTPVTPAPTPVQEVSINVTAPKALATLKVGAAAYSLPVIPNETLITAMIALASTSSFTYTSRDYPGLGVFIDSINGITSGGGKYWVFYVNGISATQGVSTTIIKQGDLIEFRYESSY